jgi:hypothetical protein
MRIGNEVRKRTGNGTWKSTGDETRKGIGEEARKGIQNETHAAPRKLDAATEQESSYSEWNVGVRETRAQLVGLE